MTAAVAYGKFKAMTRNLILLACLIFCGPVLAQEQGNIQTGIFTKTFDQRSPLSDPGEMIKITRWPEDKLRDYKIADHTFQLVVPEDYDGSEAFGLVVFIHPNNAINTERFYGKTIQDVLAKHNMIWVSYNNAGNDVMPNVRLGLALDAVHNMTQNFRIDADRVYVSGLSGGGRITCMAGIYYPQVFTGAVPIVGTLYFRDVKLPEDEALRALIKPEPPKGASVWPRGLLQPSARRLAQMKKQQRWVLLAGELDYNMPQMRAHFEQGFQRDGFALAQYFEVKGMGHNYPEAKWYDKALELLEQGRDEAEHLKPADERTQRLAQRRLDVAMRALQRDRERGVRALEKLIEDLPNTVAAEQAKGHLQSLEDKK